MRRMTGIGVNRPAFLFGLALPIIQATRTLLWGWWPEGWEWPISVDAYVIGALLLFGAVMQSRGKAAAPRLLVAGWAFAAGILYRSFFEQMADPARHNGHEWFVMSVKGLLLCLSVVGLVGAIYVQIPDEMRKRR